MDAESLSKVGMTIGEYIDRHITFYLPVQLVQLLQMRFKGELFSEDEYERECGIRQLYTNSIAHRNIPLSGETPLERFDDTDVCESLAEALACFGVESLYRTPVKEKARSRYHHNITQAYCGWLVQQEAYHSDIEDLKARFHEELLKNGVPRPPDARFENAGGDDWNDDPLSQAIKQICSKWRLQEFASIELPTPLEPKVVSRNLFKLEVPIGILMLAIPDTFPISGRGEAVDLLESQRNNAGAEHLSSWFDLIKSSSPRKRRLETLVRQYHVQHYWRVLQQNYSSRLKRRKTAIIEEFATYFDISFDVMKADFRGLNKLPFGHMNAPLEKLY